MIFFDYLIAAASTLLWLGALVWFKAQHLDAPDHEWREAMARHLNGAVGWYREACSPDDGKRLHWVNHCEESRADIDTFVLDRAPQRSTDEAHDWVYAAFASLSLLSLIGIHCVWISRRSVAEAELERMRQRKRTHTS